MCAYIKPCVPFYRAMSELNLFVSLKNLIAISWPAAVLFGVANRDVRSAPTEEAASCLASEITTQSDPTRPAMQMSLLSTPTHLHTTVKIIHFL